MSAGHTSEPGNYEYVTARVRSRRASLFDDEDYRKLLRMGPSEIARFMEESEYETEINALGARYGGVDLIEYALNRNLAKHFHDLLRWADGRLYDQIARYLRKFDAWNVKTALRGLYSGATAEEIEDDLIRAGELDDGTLDAMAAAGSVEDAVELLEGTMYYESLAASLEEFDRTGLLVPLENAVDRAYYGALMGGLSADDEATALYVEFLQSEIDFLNVRNVLRIARSGADLDPGDYFIEGGRLFDPAEIRQLAGNDTELVERLRGSVYGDELDAALDELERADSLIQFERALDSALLEYSDYLSGVYPLSVCPVLGFVLAKEREVDNVRAIARGREAGLTEEEIEEKLVML